MRERPGFEQWWLPAVLAAAVAIAVFLVYRPALAAGFYFDDAPNIVDAAALHWSQFSIQGIRDVLTDALIVRRPLANLSFALNHLAAGLEPRGYHLVNIWIHLAVGLALVWVSTLYERETRTSGRNGSALVVSMVVTALFLLHPLNIQAVTYVVQRMSSMAALFSLWAFGFYLLARRSAGGPRAGLLFGLAGASWLLAFGSKENVLTLPLVVLAYEASFHRDRWLAWARRLRAEGRTWVVVVAAGALVAVGVWVVLGYRLPVRIHWEETLPLRDFSGEERVLTQARVHLLYLSLLVWPGPTRLNLEHDVPISHSLLDPPTTAIAVLFWLAVGVGAVYLTRRSPRYGFPLLAYLLLHSVESAPISLELVFEHRMYLPMTALALLATVSIADMDRRKRLVAVAVAMLLAVPLGVATYRRNLVWSDNLAFHYDCATKSPEKYRPQLNLGIELGKAGRVDEAVPFLSRAAELKPDSGKARNQLASAYLRLGEFDRALYEAELAVRLDPQNGYARYNLAWVLDRNGRSSEAVTHYLEFLRLAPPKLESFRAPVERRLQELTRRP